MSTQVKYTFSLSEGTSAYFQGFVDGLNEAQEHAEFVNDPSGETTPQLTVTTSFPSNTAFWSVLFEDVVNGNDELELDVKIEVTSVDEAGILDSRLIYETSMENLAVILVSTINSGGSALTFVLFELEGSEVPVDED